MKTQSQCTLPCHFTSPSTRICQSIFYLFTLCFVALVHSILIYKQVPYIKIEVYIAMLLLSIFPKNKFVFMLQQKTSIPLHISNNKITNLKFVF